jgi:protoporphyrinogen/coproporphyrinogen III oxidase
MDLVYESGATYPVEMTQMAAKSVIVIGAGMAGLAAAHALQQAGLKVTVLERADHVGGRVHTEVVEGFHIDTGAKFIANFYPNTKRLLSGVGLAKKLSYLPRRSAILRAGRLHILRPDLRSLATDLITFNSKVQLVKVLRPLVRNWNSLDSHAFWKALKLDTRSITEYARRTWPDEVLDYLIEPPLSGFLYWTPENTSQAMLFVLLKASLGIRLLTLPQGMGQLPETLATTLTIHRNAEVMKVVPNPGGLYSVHVRLDGEVQTLNADGIVCATPAFAVPVILPELSSVQREFFENITYSRNVVAAIGLRQRLPSKAYGLLFPRTECNYLALASVESARDPKGNQFRHELLTLYASGPGVQELLLQPDVSIRNLLVKDLLKAGPAYQWNADAELFYHVFRWPNALPEFNVGYFRRLKQFAEGRIETGALVFAGDYIGGPFIEGAVTSGLQAAERLLGYFQLEHGKVKR